MLTQHQTPLEGREVWEAENFLRDFSNRVGRQTGELSPAHLLATMAYTSLRDARRELSAAEDGRETALVRELSTPLKVKR